MTGSSKKARARLAARGPASAWVATRTGPGMAHTYSRAHGRVEALPGRVLRRRCDAFLHEAGFPAWGCGPRARRSGRPHRARLARPLGLGDPAADAWRCRDRRTSFTSGSRRGTSVAEAHCPRGRATDGSGKCDPPSCSPPGPSRSAPVRPPSVTAPGTSSRSSQLRGRPARPRRSSGDRLSREGPRHHLGPSSEVAHRLDPLEAPARIGVSSIARDPPRSRPAR